MTIQPASTPPTSPPRPELRRSQAIHLGFDERPTQERVSDAALALLIPPPSSDLTGTTPRLEETTPQKKISRLTLPGMIPTPVEPSQESIEQPRLTFDSSSDEHKSPRI